MEIRQLRIDEIKAGFEVYAYLDKLNKETIRQYQWVIDAYSSGCIQHRRRADSDRWLPSAGGSQTIWTEVIQAHILGNSG